MNPRRRIDRSPRETPKLIVGVDQTQRQIAKHHGCAEDYDLPRTLLARADKVIE